MKGKIEFFASLAVVIVFGGAIALFALRYLLPALAPFIIAWAVAMAVRAPAERLSARSHIPSRLLRLFLSVLAVTVLFAALFLLVWRTSAAVWSMLSEVGEDGFYRVIAAITEIPILSSSLSSEIGAKLEAALSGMISELLSTLAGAVTGIVSAVPNALFFVLITVIALVYVALDLDRINAWIMSLFPEKYREKLGRVKKRIISVCKKYACSYAILLSITFALMLAGLLLLRIRYAMLVAVILAVLDLLPVVGVGAVLVPWSVISFATGDVRLGAGLLILFIVNTVVRQLSEPKIVGKSLNMHPLLTLVLLYAGYSILGFLGILLVPIISIGIGALSQKGDVSQEI